MTISIVIMQVAVSVVAMRVTASSSNFIFLSLTDNWAVGPTLPTMPILLGILYRPPDKPDFIKHINNVFTETGILDKQECYLLGD